MPTITIHPGVTVRRDDVHHTFLGGGDGRHCQCQWWMHPNAEFNRATRAERETMLDAELAESPAPGLVAFVDDAPAGWVRVGPRTAQRRIARTRVLRDATPPPDDPGIWAVSCFVVRKEYRGLALMERLLDAAVAHASVYGARRIEGYPLDAAAREGRTAPTMLFRGTLSVFLRAGFREIARPRPDLVIVVLDPDDHGLPDETAAAQVPSVE